MGYVPSSPSVNITMNTFSTSSRHNLHTIFIASELPQGIKEVSSYQKGRHPCNQIFSGPRGGPLSHCLVWPPSFSLAHPSPIISKHLWRCPHYILFISLYFVGFFAFFFKSKFTNSMAVVLSISCTLGSPVAFLPSIPTRGFHPEILTKPKWGKAWASAFLKQPKWFQNGARVKDNYPLSCK